MDEPIRDTEHNKSEVTERNSNNRKVGYKPEINAEKRGNGF